MKKIILTIAIVLGGLGVFAQPTPPNNQTGGAGQGNPIGGGAPIDGGFSILLAMGAIYGANKVFRFKKEEE